MYAVDDTWGSLSNLRAKAVLRKDSVNMLAPPSGHGVDMTVIPNFKNEDLTSLDESNASEESFILSLMEDKQVDAIDSTRFRFSMLINPPTTLRKDERALVHAHLRKEK
jgi:hypothetical protein